MLEDGFHDSRSTARGQARMLMKLHVRVGFEGLNVCTPISLSNPSPHEQPIETSHLERCKELMGEKHPATGVILNRLARLH
ncbi:MAG: hypothetical protein LC775_18115, partial [Acidobacteria bacterium]|nr:hypothetical protein [Acidobacteriota bacterium]